MGKYIGSNSPYGLHEKQELQIQQGRREFALDYKVGYSTSILVVYVIAGGTKVLEPGVDFDIIDGGTKLKINFETYDGDAQYNERLYVIYLGKQVSTPVALDRRPIRVEVTNTTSQTLLVSSTTHLSDEGLFVYKNETKLKHNTDFTISTDGHSIVLSQAPLLTDVYEIYCLSGIQKLSRTQLDDNSVTTEKLKEKSVTSDKLDLRYDEYPVSINGIGGLVLQNKQVVESVYMLQGTPGSTFGAPVKVRLKFKANLTGQENTIIRFSLPDLLPNVSTIISGSVTITNDISLETGILTWAANNAIDIHRQFGVNFELRHHTFEAAFEYIAKT